MAKSKKAKSKAKPAAKAASKIAKKTAPKKAAKAKPKAAQKTMKKAAAKTTPKVARKAAPKAVSAPGKSAKTTAADFAKVLKPLDNRVIVRREDFTRRTAGGLFIPDSVSFDEGHRQGEVVAVGPGHRNKKGHVRPLDVKKGDTVLFNNYAGSEVRVEGAEFLILAEDEILGVMKP